MLPSFLITFREVIEATLIVATILGILTKIGKRSHVRIVWLATACAAIISLLLLIGGSLLGLKVQELYEGVEKIFEGVLMMVSGIFITWAVFWLHTYFAQHKVKLLQKVRSTIDEQQKRGLFVLVFTAVFREGFEIVLFLSTVYLSSSPQEVLSGFGIGMAGGLLVSLLLFTATLKMPVYYAFRATSVLLVLFAAGLLGRGVHEFTEAGLLPELSKVTLVFLPQKGTITADMIKSIFGITRSMDMLQAAVYGLYISAMSYVLSLRSHGSVMVDDQE